MNNSRLKEIVTYNSVTGLFLRVKSSSSKSGMRDATLIKPSGYCVLNIDRSEFYAHRMAWLYVYGKYPDGEIDHINGIKSDNRISNLREVSRKENLKNKLLYRKNKSGISGVRWIEGRRMWRVRIGVKGKQINIGSFKCKLDAVASIIRARKNYGFHDHHGERPLAML